MKFLAQLGRILSSSSFVSTERRARLLEFLVRESLKESSDTPMEAVITIEVFDRNGEYDPKIDSVVRVEMGRLRSRLIEYYADPGANDPVRIEIPKGSYRPIYTAL